MPVILPDNLTEAQLDGRACVRCGAEDRPMRPVETYTPNYVGSYRELCQACGRPVRWLSAQLFECVDVDACGHEAG